MKKILPFIIIMSLLVSFIPCFDYSVYAFDTVSDNNGGGGGHHRGSTYTGLMGELNNDLVEHGYVLKEPDEIVGDFLIDLGIVRSLDTAVSDYNNFIINNPDYDIDSLISQLSSFLLDYAKNNVPYYIRSTLNISDLFSAMYPYGAYDSANWQSQFNQIKTFINASGGPYITALFFNAGNLGWGQVYAYRLEKDFFKNDLQFYIYSSNYESVFFDNIYGIFNAGEGNAQGISAPSYLGLTTNGVVNDSVSCDGVRFVGSNIGSLQSYYLNYYSLGYGLLKFIRANTSTYAYGTIFVVPDGFDSYEFPIFKNLTELQGFYSGNSLVYQFVPDVDFGDYGSDIDYSRLYDLISSTVQGNSDNIIDSINNVANNYLQQQLDLLHDINNALNDGNGQSWLRRIYGILDYNFPLTLNAFDDLIHAVQNISVSGGGGDFSEATQVLHEIDSKLGILIDEPFTDLNDSDWNEMKSRVQTKFPFCIFSDIVAISVILNRPPQQPDLNFPIPIIGSESENSVHIDLSPYEHARPFVHGALIFLFIIGLLALSVKIFDHLKS